MESVSIKNSGRKCLRRGDYTTIARCLQEMCTSLKIIHIYIDILIDRYNIYGYIGDIERDIDRWIER